MLLSEHGFDQFIAERVIGHVNKHNYNRDDFLAQKRDTLDRYAVILARLVGENILPLAARVG